MIDRIATRSPRFIIECVAVLVVILVAMGQRPARNAAGFTVGEIDALGHMTTGHDNVTLGRNAATSWNVALGNVTIGATGYVFGK